MYICTSVREETIFGNGKGAPVRYKNIKNVCERANNAVSMLFPSIFGQLLHVKIGHTYALKTYPQVHARPYTYSHTTRENKTDWRRTHVVVSEEGRLFTFGAGNEGKCVYSNVYIRLNIHICYIWIDIYLCIHIRIAGEFILNARESSMDYVHSYSHTCTQVNLV